MSHALQLLHYRLGSTGPNQENARTQSTDDFLTEFLARQNFLG
jgi:hypothetical protein